MKASPILTPVAGADGEQSFGFRDGEAERLLAENVLAGFSGSDGPGDVEVIGQRIVDGVDIGVGEKFFIRAVGRGNAQGGCRLLGLRKTARCDGDDTGVLASLHGGDDFLGRCGGAENSPAQLAGHVYLSSIRILGPILQDVVQLFQAHNQASGSGPAAP